MVILYWSNIDVKEVMFGREDITNEAEAKVGATVELLKKPPKSCIVVKDQTSLSRDVADIDGNAPERRL